MEIPVVDIRSWLDGERSRDTAAAVDHALRTSGFLLVTGHGIPEQVPPELRRMALEFFHQPAAEKAHAISDSGARGWIPPATVANSRAYGVDDSPPDLHETILFGRELADMGPDATPEDHPDNVWPPFPDGVEDAVRGYLGRMHALAESLMSLCAAALGLEERHFAPALEYSIGTLGLHWYPAYDVTGPPQPGQFRIGPHTDYGAITILDRQAARSGLQIQAIAGVDPSDAHGGEWIDAPSVPGALTINIGDLMARWTGDRWRSTRHRVPAPTAEAATEEIVSLVFFYDIDPRTVVAPLPAPAAGPTVYAPVVAGDYVQAKIDSIAVA